MNVFKKIYNRLSEMTEPAWLILKLALVISSTMLFCSLVLFLFSLPLSPDTYTVYKFAHEFRTMPSAILLIGVLGSAIAEDIIIQKKQ